MSITGDLAIILPATITPTAYIAPENMTYEEWFEACKTIGSVNRCSRWWAADILLWGEQRWGEEYAQVADSLGFDPQTLANLLWIARKFPPSRRRENLSFGHHEIVAKFTPEVQDVWLDLAEQHSLPIAKLKQAIKSKKPEEEKTLRVYVASSWRNKHFPDVISEIMDAGFDAYDFRSANANFSWNDLEHTAVTIDGTEWRTDEFVQSLTDPRAIKAFDNDMDALKKADACVLVMPAGRSAHLELGYAVGRGKPTAIYLTEPMEPELMAKMAGSICLTIQDVLDFLRGIER